MLWSYKNSTVTDIPDGDAIGFVYLITNTQTGKRYIGKKNFYAAQTRIKTVVVKSTGVKKKKKIRSKVESNWKDYYGSSEDVKRDVGLLGTEFFSREVLKLCYSKGELSYYEAKFQFEKDVLLDPEMWYNNWISVRVQRVHLKNLLTKEK